MLPLRAYTFIGLNAIRVLSIISLLLVFSSSIVIMVSDIKAVNHFVNAGASNSSTEVDYNYIDGSTVPNQPAGAFWAVLNRLLIIFQVIVLILSELAWPQSFFIKYFPVLGRDFGTGALGVIQCLVGAAVLSHYVTTFALVSGFFVFVLGCINILVGLIFRASAKTRRSLTAWKEHAKGALPTHVGPVDIRPMVTGASSFVSNKFGGEHDEKKAGYSQDSVNSEKTGFGFGRQGEKAAALKGFLISKPLESLPRYATGPHV